MEEPLSVDDLPRHLGIAVVAGEARRSAVANLAEFVPLDFATGLRVDESHFHSGDLGQYVFGDRLRYVSRLKDMLKVGGENVAAAEIEDHLQTHPAVHTAQVVSAPDARYHEVPAAYIQLKPGASTTEAELIEHCRGVIATFKVPRYVRFVAEFPMSGTKIKKNELRDMIAAELREKGITEAPKVTSRTT